MPRSFTTREPSIFDESVTYFSKKIPNYRAVARNESVVSEALSKELLGAEEKECLWCGDDFEAKHRNSKTCCPECTAQLHRFKKKRRRWRQTHMK